MTLFELFLIGAGLSMDAFAAAVCQGLAMPRLDLRRGGVVALYFGAFQALMPVLGYLLGASFADRIQAVDHWAAFILLGLIGGNMLREAVSGGEEASCPAAEALDHRKLLALAVATSIDALAVGVTFAFLEVDIRLAAAVIGCTTFCLSLAGVAVGRFFGTRFQRQAEAAGGAILVLLGTKILLEHLGIL